MNIRALIRCGIAVLGFYGTSTAMAQSEVALETRQFSLMNLSQQMRQQTEFDRRMAADYARRNGIPLRREFPNGKVLELQRAISGQQPVYYTTFNVDAADSVSTDELYPGGSAGLNLTGSGMTVGEWDGGAIYAAHPDFAGRLLQVDGATVMSNHSTHVAGTLIGEGGWLDPSARGMAWQANLDAYDWNFDTAEMAAAAAGGMLLSNHSYGIAAGWIYTAQAAPDTWWWIGGADPSDVEDPNFGYYDSESQLWDQIALDAPYYLIVKAAGNDRTDIGPNPGEQYLVINQAGDPLFYSTLPRNSDCAPAGYDCLPTASVAKNILTIGAVDDVLGGYSPLTGPLAVNMADFSSWGPTDDGRIKPDLVGNGVLLQSTYGDFPYFAAAAGTSMAAPNVTGSLLLLQQHHENLNGPGNYMRSATLKALAIHTADETGDADGPDYEFGWGLLNTKNAAQVITEDGAGEHQMIESGLSDGATDTWPVTVVGADKMLVATLVWMDPPGTPAAPSLDPTDLMLVNDLDLRIVDGGTTHLPWILDPSVPAAAATRGDNFRDNVEQVVVENATPGTYNIQVSHKGALQDGLNQHYSLIISVRSAPPTGGSSLLINEDFSGGMPAGWSVQTVKGVPWTVNSPVSGDSRLDNNTGGSGQFAVVDNNFINDTLTSLVTPQFDVSDSTALVLRFNSYYIADTFESLHVDVSTNSGASWGNVWTHTGFNPFPTQYVLDLSGVGAGQPSFTVRFRFFSGDTYSGDVWQIDNVQLEQFGGGGSAGDPPGAASNPGPSNGAVDVDVNADLSWTAGTDTDTHDVYLDTVSPPDGGAPASAGQAGTSYDPGLLSEGTTYYWQVNETNVEGTTEGPVWSFITAASPPPLPGPPGNPAPAAGAGDVDVNADLFWTAGTDTDTHDVYLSTVNPPDGGAPVSAGQVGTSYDAGLLSEGTTYYWQVNETNTSGTTEGPVWSFTTATPPPPVATMHISGLAGHAVPANKGRWTAVVDIRVDDNGGSPEAGVTIEGSWSNGASGGSSCVTDASGSCAVQKNSIRNRTSSVMFTVNSLDKATMTYEPGDNVSGNSHVVNKDDVDQVPSAANDSYSTDTNTALSDNVMGNDSHGDGPATINGNTNPGNGVLSISANGAFTYTPNTDWTGEDSFTYSLIDADGDVSNMATVTIAVGSAPPPSADRTVSTRTYKVKGVQHVEVTWENFVGSDVDISRDGDPVATTANNGSYTENLGVKGGGTYQYTVCEAGTANCASASATF